MLNLEQLHILQLIVEHGSFKAASDKLHKTQAALSIAIKKLEQRVGFELLDRSQYRAQLTERGSLFYRQVIPLLQRSEQLESFSKLIAGGDEPHYKMAIELACAPIVYTKPIQKTMQKFKATQFSIDSGFRFTAIHSVLMNDANIAIAPWFHLMHGLADFETKKISEYRFVIVAASSMVMNEKIDQLEKLAQYPVVTTGKSEFSFDSERLTAIGSASQQIRVNSLELIRSTIINQSGWGILPYHYIEKDLKEKKLSILKLNDLESEFTGEIRAIRRANKTHGPVADYLWQNLG